VCYNKYIKKKGKNEMFKFDDLMDLLGVSDEDKREELFQELVLRNISLTFLVYEDRTVEWGILD
jgi:hypothetical protein